MANFTPAIISENFDSVKARIEKLEGLTQWVHVDVMDGRFVPSKVNWAPEDLFEINGGLKIEAHLMIEEPEEVLHLWRDVVDRVTVHLESATKIEEIVDGISGSSAELGIALELDTPVELVFPYVERVDVIQLMSISKIGYKGESFAPEVLRKIQLLREKFPNVKIQIDGGMNLDTARQVLEAGADTIVAESAVWNSPDPVQAIKDFQDLCRKKS